MSEALDDKKDGLDEESHESKDATEALDERIAPSTPRGAEGAASPSATVSEADEEAASDDADGDSTAPAPQRSQAKRWALGIAAAAIVLCAVTAGVGYAAGRFGSEPASAPSATQTDTSSKAEGDHAKVDDQAEQKNVEESEDDGSAASEDEAPAAEGAGESGASASEDAASPSSGGESSAGESGSESAPAPAPAPVPEPEPAPAPQPSTITVSVYIDSSRAASSGYPSSLGGGSVTLNQGASVYDALCALGVSVGGSSSYVSSIGGLAEFACGPGSGWLYFVNGSSPGYGCGSYILNGGESITWIYTCDLGNDV